MATPKSPFVVIQNFLSPKVCEQLVYKLGFYAPDVDTENKPLKMTRHNEYCEDIIYGQFEQMIPQLEQYYGFQHNGTESVTFEFLPEEYVAECRCENSKYIEKKWARVYNRDISCVLFLSDYNEEPPFDSDYEVYGGKLEFPQHQFGFNPERGTLIIFPSGPHFINGNAAIVYGDSFQARFHLAAQMPYLYQPDQFPGNYTNWFNDLS